jgi:signal transduction histidine kinase/phage shock protein PspC (stress-responsive transcriptional regulator)
VAAAVAARTGLELSVVRLALVVLTPLTYGFVTMVYLLAWLLIPAAGSDRGIGHKAGADRRGIALAAGSASLLIVLLITANIIGAGWFGSVGWLLVIDLVCLVLIWRNGDEQEQTAIRRLVEPLFALEGSPRRRATALRVVIAAVLLIAGVAILGSAHESLKMLRPLGGLALVIAAIAVILGPWWLGIARNLVEERQARIRAEERADMASRVHDSVLQTLAMIQRRADQPQQVIQLARAQERELRAWLFDGQAPGSLGGEETTLAAGVRLIQQEVEAQHGMTVEAVTVSDCDLDENLGALLAAAREATVNAAKWSGAEVVSLFAEVEPEAVSLFVRDRGRGFDPAAVPGDRKGLAESVHARMSRRGGTATVRSAPGQGTEVSLTMPRAAGKRQPSRA